MYCLGILIAFFGVSASSITSSQCSCSSGTLSHSYGVAQDVFSGINDGTEVVVTSVFKGSFKVNELIYIRYSCGAFPTRVDSEGVFFTTSVSSVGGRIVTYLADCTRNGAITDVERTQLRTGQFAACTDSTGRIYQEGTSFPVDCNTCSCSAGSIICTKMACNVPLPSKGCSLNTGKMIPEGAATKVDCNTCICSNGNLACTEMACAPSYCTDSEGRRRINNELWTDVSGCKTWICQNGLAKVSSDDCDRSSTSKSKLLIIGVSLAAIIVVIIVISIATLIRNRMRSRDADRDGILLDDVSRDSDSDDITYNTPSGGFSPQPYGNVVTQPSMVYSSASPVWGGQPLQNIQTTPMVLMTQTGEPVVVQVAYM